MSFYLSLDLLFNTFLLLLTSVTNFEQSVFYVKLLPTAFYVDIIFTDSYLVEMMGRRENVRDYLLWKHLTLE